MKNCSFEEMAQFAGGRDEASEHNTCLVWAAVGVLSGCAGVIFSVMGPATGGAVFILGTTLLGLGYSAWSLGNC